MQVKTFEFNYFGVNTYIVWNEATRETAIIDPGMFKPSEYDIFTEFIKEKGLKIVRLINTHMHIDHIMGDDFVEEHYGVGLTAHRADAFWGEARDIQAAMFHLKNLNTTPIKIDIEVNQGEKIYLGNEWMEVLEVPGHSPGSIALYCSHDNFVITGDALFDGSIGRTDLHGGDFKILIGSIKNRLLTLPPQTIVYPGHGPQTTIGKEIESNPFLTDSI